MDFGSLLGLLAVFALVAANGFFVAAEFALVKIRKTRVDQLVAEGQRTALFVARPLYLFARLFRPIIWLMNSAAIAS